MSPQQLLEKLISISPDFCKYWERSDNYYKDEKGTFTFHGAFSEYSSFVKIHATMLTEEEIKKIGAFISECAVTLNSDLGNASTTCFIENISGEDPSLMLKPFLHGEALRFFKIWNPEK